MKVGAFLTLVLSALQYKDKKSWHRMAQEIPTGRQTFTNLHAAATVVAVTKLHASRPRKIFIPLTAQIQVTSTALLALLRCEF
jgi:hypothetical protein